MSRTTVITSVDDLDCIKIFDPAAAYLLIKEFNNGKKIEKVQSSFKDLGNDYTEFKLEGKTVCHINGY
jgi:hypothetical protein